ncbi:MAG: hypothetical protein JW720_14025 [Sedimentisphaerales bacterium]|nr:hypothetical protein [Sedimentisphaerales bacterium]
MADNKKKSGLHKNISSIFDGVPIPNDQGAASANRGSEQPKVGYDSPRPSTSSVQNPQIPGSYQQFRQSPRGGARLKAGAEAKGPLGQVAKKLFAPKPGVSPARQKVMVLAVPLLLVVFIVVVTKFVGLPSFAVKAPVIPVPKLNTAAAADEPIWQKPEPYPAGLRDPMELTDDMVARIEAKAQQEAQAKIDAAAARNQTAAGTGDTQAIVAKMGELTVKGILFSADNPAAVIGTRIAHVGDTIADAKILKITKKNVEFERDGKTWTQEVEP